MAKPLRKIFQESEIARNLRDEVKELPIRQVIQRLRDNNLSDRGPTQDQRECLMRFEIREMAIPGLTPVCADVASALVSEPQRIPNKGLERHDNERNANRQQHMVRVEATVHVAEQI